MVRPPAVAGRFYPDQADLLSEQVASYCVAPAESTRRKAMGCVVPHAGYRFSGYVAGAVYARLELPRYFLLLGPRHYPRGEAQAILSEGSWQTPLGRAGQLGLHDGKPTHQALTASQFQWLCGPFIISEIVACYNGVRVGEVEKCGN